MINTEAILSELLAPESRYKKNTNVIEYDDALMFDVPYRISAPNQRDDRYLVVTPEFINRLDKVANGYYQNSKYWWVIGFINKAYDPFDIKNGKVLRIPSVQKLILNGVI